MYVEKPLCDLEAQYSSPEDRAWLKATIVDSLILRFLGDLLSYDVNLTCVNAQNSLELPTHRPSS